MRAVPGMELVPRAVVAVGARRVGVGGRGRLALERGSAIVRTATGRQGGVVVHVGREPLDTVVVVLVVATCLQASWRGRFLFFPTPGNKIIHNQFLFLIKMDDVPCTLISVFKQNVLFLF